VADVADAGSTSFLDAKAPATVPDPRMADAHAAPVAEAGSVVPASAAGGTVSTCGSCASHEFCDVPTGHCVDKYQPWQLDCAQLPTSTTCQGGPREVLLVAHSLGAVSMFDPTDGHFLGFFSRQDLGRDRSFVQAAQGPDQCIYLLDTTTHDLQRWATNGASMGVLELPGRTVCTWRAKVSSAG
jgi:hypothetical protein